MIQEPQSGAISATITAILTPDLGSTDFEERHVRSPDKQSSVYRSPRTCKTPHLSKNTPTGSRFTGMHKVTLNAIVNA